MYIILKREREREKTPQELERAVPEHFMTITTGYHFPEKRIQDLRPGKGVGPGYSQCAPTDS